MIDTSRTQTSHSSSQLRYRYEQQLHRTTHYLPKHSVQLHSAVTNSHISPIYYTTNDRRVTTRECKPGIPALHWKASGRHLKQWQYNTGTVVLNNTASGRSDCLSMQASLQCKCVKTNSRNYQPESLCSSIPRMRLDDLTALPCRHWSLRENPNNFTSLSAVCLDFQPFGHQGPMWMSLCQYASR